MASCMLTTFDNPYNPFVNFDDWYRFDMDKGYNSCAYLDRIAKTSSQLSDKENDEEVERAIDEIIKYDFMNLYMKLRESDEFDYEKNKAFFDETHNNLNDSK